MVDRLQFFLDEITDILDVKYIAGSTIGYTLPPVVYEISHINLMLKSLLPNIVKVKNKFEDIRPKSNSSTNKTFGLPEKSLFYTILRFAESHFGVIGDIPGFVQLIPGCFKSDKPIYIRGVDKIHLNFDYFNGSIVNGIREPILYSFTPNSPPGHKIYKESNFKKDQ